MADPVPRVCSRRLSQHLPSWYPSVGGLGADQAGRVHRSAGTGGGADQMRGCSRASSPEQLDEQPMIVVNKPGGAGAKLRVRRAKGDPKIIITLSNLFTTLPRQVRGSTGRT
jgi:hypothetical protein